MLFKIKVDSVCNTPRNAKTFNKAHKQNSKTSRTPSGGKNACYTQVYAHGSVTSGDKTFVTQGLTLVDSERREKKRLTHGLMRVSPKRKDKKLL